MEKVWFKLRQTDYSPEDEKAIGTGRETGPLCLGHFISDLRNMDFVLNGGEIEPFPANMAVFRTHTMEFGWDNARRVENGFRAGAGAPIAAAVAGVAANAGLGFVFRQTVRHWEQYDRLDTYVVQPSMEYVADCLENDKLASHVAGKKSWSLFMITGVKVARGGRRSTGEYSERGVDGDGEVGYPSLASANGSVNFKRGASLQYGGTHASDFIWALRLAKVQKGFLRRDWSVKAYTRRATFDSGHEAVNIKAVVEHEGMEGIEVFEDEELGEALVLKERLE